MTNSSRVRTQHVSRSACRQENFLQHCVKVTHTHTPGPTRMQTGSGCRRWLPSRAPVRRAACARTVSHLAARALCQVTEDEGRQLLIQQRRAVRHLPLNEEPRSRAESIAGGGAAARERACRGRLCSPAHHTCADRERQDRRT